MEITKIYSDMDGVCADFDKAVKILTGFSPDNGDNLLPDDEMWAAIMKEDNFYRNLDMCEGFMRIWNLILPHHPEILTAIPRKVGMPDAEAQKRDWTNIHLGSHIPMHIGPYSRDKKKFARPGYLLIDDRESNIDEWRSAGGIGILHIYNNIDNTVNQLFELGFRYDIS